MDIIFVICFETCSLVLVKSCVECNRVNKKGATFYLEYLMKLKIDGFFPYSWAGLIIYEASEI